MTTATESAAKLYRAGKLREAFAEYTRCAEDGEVHAQMFLAWMYKTGCGTQKNRDEALRWCKIAAESGQPLAQELLGYFYYENGNYNEALKWYEAAASQGYMSALWRLGRMYNTGKGVAVNREKAFTLFEEASQKGHVFSKREVAWMSIKGHRGVTHIGIGIGLFALAIFELIRIALKSPSDERTRN